MCSDRDSVGVTWDGGRSLTAVASTAAHELGHIFNMGHDGKMFDSLLSDVACMQQVVVHESYFGYEPLSLCVCVCQCHAVSILFAMFCLVCRTL